jgi:hypothetical protein
MAKQARVLRVTQAVSPVIIAAHACLALLALLTQALSRSLPG